MNAVKRQIPNLFTLGNLSCGVLAILFVFKDQAQTSALLIIVAAVLDFFDGFLARALKVSGELGKQLDSLADLVTFGVAPSFMLMHFSDGIDERFQYAFLLLAIFSAYRLAKFNIDTRQTTTFIGVPTPITGISVASWAFVSFSERDLIFGHEWAYVIYCLLISLMLVSEIPMPSLKIKKGPVSNYYQHLFLALSAVVLALFFSWFAVPLFYAVYVLSSILINFASKK